VCPCELVLTCEGQNLGLVAFKTEAVFESHYLRGHILNLILLQPQINMNLERYSLPAGAKYPTMCGSRLSNHICAEMVVQMEGTCLPHSFIR
jgi:hypothetical protein